MALKIFGAIQYSDYWSTSRHWNSLSLQTLDQSNIVDVANNQVILSTLPVSHSNKLIRELSPAPSL